MRLDAWSGTVVTSLIETETQGGHYYKLYVDSYERLVLQLMGELAVNVGAIEEHLAK